MQPPPPQKSTQTCDSLSLLRGEAMHNCLRASEFTARDHYCNGHVRARAKQLNRLVLCAFLSLSLSLCLSFPALLQPAFAYAV